MMRKLVVEAIGTFFLVLTVGLTVTGGSAGPFAPIAIGGILATMIYAGGHISGGHYNPAVTLAVMLRGRATPAELGGYWAAQVVGGALAAALVGALITLPDTAPAPPATGPAFAAEFVFTFALAFVVLNVATARGTSGNSFYGAAIGTTVLVGAYAVGDISGAVFNPAVAVGVTIMKLTAPSFIWVFVLAQLLGGAAAGLLFNVLDLGDDKPTTATPADQARLEPTASTGNTT